MPHETSLGGTDGGVKETTDIQGGAERFYRTMQEDALRAKSAEHNIKTKPKSVIRYTRPIWCKSRSQRKGHDYAWICGVKSWRSRMVDAVGTSSSV